MNRADFQQLAEDRILDAGALLAAERWSGAYYLAGYAVECALKACVAKLTNQHDFPDKSFAQRCFTHDVETLLGLARLKEDRDSETTGNEQLGTNWLKVQLWKEDARYQIKTKAEASEIYNAIIDETDGVMKWIKARW